MQCIFKKITFSVENGILWGSCQDLPRGGCLLVRDAQGGTGLA